MKCWICGATGPSVRLVRTLLIIRKPICGNCG